MSSRAYEHRPLGAVSLAGQPPVSHSAGPSTPSQGQQPGGGRGFGSTSNDSATPSRTSADHGPGGPQPLGAGLAPQPPIHPHAPGSGANAAASHPNAPHGLVVAPNGMMHSGPTPSGGVGGGAGSGAGGGGGGGPAAIAAAAAQAQAQAQAQAAHAHAHAAAAVAAAAANGAPPVVPHPSAQRLNDLLEYVKAEFEQVAGEGGILRAQREEYEAMSAFLGCGGDIARPLLTLSPLLPVHSHASELNAMRAMVYDLERKYHDDKRLCVLARLSGTGRVSLTLFRPQPPRRDDPVAGREPPPASPTRLVSRFSLDAAASGTAGPSAHVGTVTIVDSARKWERLLPAAAATPGWNGRRVRYARLPEQADAARGRRPQEE